MQKEKSELSMDLEQLYQFDGENDPKILVSVCGHIFDVSENKRLYGPGKGYAFTAGHDITFMLAKMSLSEKDLNRVHFQLSDQEKDVLVSWILSYLSKYPVVGKVKGLEDLCEEEWTRGQEKFAKRETPNLPFSSQKIGKEQPTDSTQTDSGEKAKKPWFSWLGGFLK
ncbi:hypothetical protein RFI_11925 [Reticulomyxa filosa]|uniref:Cytochrome b5 heme-binding domain-containing protein n=1 Tax=Reticulomyxa filosa TaxID=46433 RepID=X6NGU8_RETFI|nr:hypothetical protein RFI_11925 [Reticulomyxa filosa]|eukprot:ETO25216.1 hypothetical protein RFI_11925 [Reticulomyxa filosa]